MICDLFSSLRSALEAAALQAGFELISNGSVCSKKTLQNRKYPVNSSPPYACIRFTCNKFRAYRKRKSVPGSTTSTTTRTASSGVRADMQVDTFVAHGTGACCDDTIGVSVAHDN